MKFTESPIPGVWTLEPERIEDERGFFARTFCRREFHQHRLDPQLVQCSVSFNLRPHTLRGMHYQEPPYEEAKLVRCTRGAVHDVVVDLRRGSPAFCRHFGIRLDAENRLALYVPPGVAHGFLTLEPATEVFYQMSEYYEPQASRGVRWDDPAFGIEWPELPAVISPRDLRYPDFAR